jgi:ketosteroid isomerase-like protein
MTTKNQLALHRIYEAFQSRDERNLIALLAREIQIIHSPGLPWGGSFERHDGAKVFLDRLMMHVNAYVSMERILDAGDHLAVTGRLYGAARRTGRRFDVPFVHLWRLEDGLAVRLEIVLDLPGFEGALADAA